MSGEATKLMHAKQMCTVSYGITCAEVLTGKCPYPLSEFQMADLSSTILQGVRPHLPDEYYLPTD
jgi:hypothetical protein